MESNPNRSANDARLSLWRLSLFALSNALLALLSLLLARPDAVSPTLWLPTAFTSAILFHSPRRYWPTLLAIALVSSLLPLPLTHVHYGLRHALIDQGQAWLGAVALCRLLPAQRPFDTLAHWLRFILTVVVTIPLLCAVLSALSNPVPSSAFVSQMIADFLSDALGMLALTPLGLLAGPAWPTRGRIPWLTLPILLVTLVSDYFALPRLPYPFTIVLIPLLWAAIVLPLWPAFLIFACSALLLCAQMNHLPLAGATPNPLLLYMPILLVLLPAHAIAIQTHAYRRERQRLQENETRLRNVMEYSAIGTALIDLQGQWIQCNPAFCQMLGYEAPTLMSMPYQQRVHPDDRQSDKRQQAALLAGYLDSYTLEKRYLHRNGQAIWTLLTVSLVRDPQAEPLYFVMQLKEINDIKNNQRQKQRLLDTLHQERERLHTTLSAIGEAVISSDPQQIIRFMNPSAEKMTGWPQGEAIGQPLDRVIQLQESNSGKARPVLRASAQDDGDDESDPLNLQSREGRRYEVQSRVAELRHGDGILMGYVVVFQDVSETRALLRQLSYSALHDALTGLPNRASFEQALRQALRGAIEHHQRHVLVFLDLDYFKSINDNAGHAAGDRLLQDLAQLMRSLLRPQDTLARLGGDEFALILCNCELEQGKLMADQLIHDIATYPFHWQGKQYTIGASAGLTQLHHDNALADEAINQADAACYLAKHRGRGRACCHAPQHRVYPASARHEPTADQLSTLLANARFTLLLRAVCSRANPQQIPFYLLDLEAYHTDGTPYSPQAFNTACLRHQRQQEVEHWLLSQILEQHAECLSRQPQALAVSLSTTSLCQPAFVGWLCDTLARSPLPADRLWLRLEESALIEQQAHTAPALNALRRYGCRLIAEGFERHLESIARLEHCQVDYVIANSGLVSQVHANRMDEMMLSLLHTQAHSYGIQTIAGPAELPATLATLNMLGIDLLFGSCLHPPLTLQQQLTQLASPASVPATDPRATVADDVTMQ
ncbi:diguanylate cyclase [Edwardsiella hoshinae]|uniref:diguanylate cyclase n=1 Tax=Edwardsiella hoshinae TaxID=93378 RepID=A0A376DJC1_9GAMM|nr:diguanylate cyclase [Edwardsiella hoshinae]QPR29488.1 diguanylate cyclase [Edwardsiella hoshinae]STC90341.1 Cyclic di-GMP phosphodiesterase Gmr [Edwardsiella hoshinae]